MKPIHVITTTLVSSFLSYAIDQATKRFFFGSFGAEPSFSLLGGIIQNIRHQNPGITFDIPLPMEPILLISLVAALLIMLGIYRAMRRLSLPEGFFLGLLLGGALGNLIDRLSIGYVRDWLLLFNRSALNIADLMILIGTLGYFWQQSKSKTTQSL